MQSRKYIDPEHINEMFTDNVSAKISDLQQPVFSFVKISDACVQCLYCISTGLGSGKDSGLGQ